MPCTAGGTPVTIDVLFVLVVLGIEQSANPTKPACSNGLHRWQRAILETVLEIGRVEPIYHDDNGRMSGQRIDAPVDFNGLICGGPRVLVECSQG